MATLSPSPSSFLTSDLKSPKIPFTKSPPPSPPASVKFRRCFSASYSSTTETSRSPPNLGSNKMSSSSSSSLYEVLGIPMGASGNEIKAAYRKLARVCHPDVVAIQRKDNSADEFMKIHAAYSTLSDPEKRADYDRKLFRKQRSYSSNFSSSTSGSSSSSSSMQSPMSGFSGYTRRNWETDQCW